MSGGPPDEEQLRAAYEAELARVSAVDVMLQAAVSLLNVAALRLRPPQEGQPPRDLEQMRDAIDGASALLGVLEQRVPQDVRPLRDALSQLQMAYAREAQGPGGSGPPQSAGPPAGSEAPGSSRGEPSGGGGGTGGQGEGGGTGEQGEGGGTGGQGGGGGTGEQGEGGSSSQHGPGPAESSGRLWVPGT